MIWNAALYLRLSNDDGDKDESNSIGSQRNITSKYAAGIPDVQVIGEYADDGFTGTNFDRPDFKRMIDDIQTGAVNCVIVKDLSRFGRDYIGVGSYLERFFPAYGVRFIAINDGYDSLTQSANDEFIMPIKNIFNAQYSKDISRKVKSSFRTLQGEGKFTGAFTSYGYIKDPENRHKLIIDEPAAAVVREIFDMYISGIGKQTIAKKLNERSIPCPSEYKKLNGQKYNNGQRLELTKYWTYSTINSILKNEMYIGNMVQNKSVRNTVRGKAKENSKDKWIKVENTHKPIINMKEWNAAQILLKRNTRQLDFNSNVGLFAGYVFCGDCGRAMSKIRQSNGQIMYICGSYKRYGADICTRHAIKLETLEQLVLNKLNEQLKYLENIELNKAEEDKQNDEFSMKKYDIMLNRIYKLKKSCYEDYKEGLLSRDDFIAYKTDYEKEEQLIRGQMAAAQTRQDDNDLNNEWIETLMKHKKIKKLDRETVVEILDKIIISETGDNLKVEIRFRFELK